MTTSVAITDLLARYQVLSDDGGTWVICRRCGERSLAGSASEGADLGELAAWGHEHKCQPALSPDAWQRAGEVVYRSLAAGDPDGFFVAWSALPSKGKALYTKAFAEGIRAVALELRESYEGDT